MLRAIMTTFHIIGSKVMRTLRFVLTYSLAILTVFVSRAADAERASDRFNVTYCAMYPKATHMMIFGERAQTSSPACSPTGG